jgi:hypothetical protein
MAKPKKTPKCGHTELDPHCPTCVKFQASWYEEAEKGSDYSDIEDPKENLEQYDRRTIAFDNRDRIQEFFLRLDAYLTNTPDIKPKHRKVLELYSKGLKVKGKGGISKRTRTPWRTIFSWLRRYKDMLK